MGEVLKGFLKIKPAIDHHIAAKQAAQANLDAQMQLAVEHAYLRGFSNGLLYAFGSLITVIIIRALYRRLNVPKGPI